MTQEDNIDESPFSILDPTLEREHRWDFAPPLLEMWAAFAKHYSQRGELRELWLRGPYRGEASAIALTAGWRPFADGESAPPERHEERFGGYLHVLPPFQPDRTLWVTGVYASLTPWNSPGVSGFRVAPDNEPDDVHFIVTFEQPVEMFVTPVNPAVDGAARHVKRFRERMHLDRYSTDVLLTTGHPPYTAVEEGNDPPDFVCSTPEGPRTVECVQFAVEGRRRAHGLFKAVRRAVVTEAHRSRLQFTNLAGQIVYAYFANPSGPLLLPPRTSDQDAVVAILDALRSYNPDPQRLWVDRDAPLPERPDLASVTTEHGCTLYSVPMAMAVPTTSFFMATGFELTLGYPTSHRPDDVWNDIVDFIRRKDTGSAQDLVITVGGPDDSGFAFPSEEWLASVALHRQREMPATDYLQRVRIHFWNSGRVLELIPTFSEVSPALFRLGYVQSHLLIEGPPLENSQ